VRSKRENCIRCICFCPLTSPSSAASKASGTAALIRPRLAPASSSLMSEDLGHLVKNQAPTRSWMRRRPARDVEPTSPEHVGCSPSSSSSPPVRQGEDGSAGESGEITGREEKILKRDTRVWAGAN
jgi:hypothetical protein